MAVNVVSIIVILLLAVLFLMLTTRAWRVRQHLFRWGGLLASCLLALILTLVAVFSGLGLYKFSAVRDIPIPDIQVIGTSEQIARGQHLADSFCTSCHSLTAELPLTGGVDLGKDIAIPLGSFISANLTPAGPLASWSDGEIFRALRNGVGQDGRWLAIMSGVRVRNMSDADTLALIAYLRSQPSLPSDIPEALDQPNLLGLVMAGAGLIPEGPPPILGSIQSPQKAATVEYGEYIFSYQDCRDCHGEDLQGGVEGQLAPIGPTLVAVKYWTTDEFITAMRTGIAPGGNPIDPPMPWQTIGRMDDEELTAMHIYLQSMH
jgi:mono/diheme cytochrome c family protein